VTGVQTCALPISLGLIAAGLWWIARNSRESLALEFAERDSLPGAQALVFAGPPEGAAASADRESVVEGQKVCPGGRPVYEKKFGLVNTINRRRKEK